MTPRDDLDEIIQRAQRWLATLACLVVFGIVLAMLFGQEARALLVMPDGKLNTECLPEPLVPPLPLPPLPIKAPGLPKQLGGTCTEVIVTADGKGAAVGWW